MNYQALCGCLDEISTFHGTLNYISGGPLKINSIQFQIQMIEDQNVKQCRQILKKNNLHPLKKLGKGAFSLVFSVEKIELKSADNQIYSVKCINKKQFSKKPYLNKYIDQQIQILKQLSHPNIVRLIRHFQDEGWIFIVMEFCDKGNVSSFQSTKEGGVFQVRQCLTIIQSILIGLDYMHCRNLIHRDIKAENVLFMGSSDPKHPLGYTTKICDLGFCREDNQNVTTFCGTTSYMAPQIFEKNVYDAKVDVWAIGVLMYKMLFGDFPFKSLNMGYEIKSKCYNGFSLKKIKYKPNKSLTKDHFQTINQLLSKIFTLNPEERISIKELRKHKLLAPSGKEIIGSLSTDTESSEEEGNIFQEEKFHFLNEIISEIKKLDFLNDWQNKCFQFYLNKVSLVILGQITSKSKPLAKIHQEVVQKNQAFTSYIANNIKKNNIAKFSQHFSAKSVLFNEFKEPYRLVVGHVFSKAHKCFNENVLLRSQIKLKLFCCHLINRIFEKEYRKQIFVSYFEWLKNKKKVQKFNFNNFRKWIQEEQSQRLVQTVENMNEKFYKRK